MFRSATIARSKAANRTQSSFNSLFIKIFLELFTRYCICTMFKPDTINYFNYVYACILPVRFLHVLRFACIEKVITKKMHKHDVFNQFANQFSIYNCNWIYYLMSKSNKFILLTSLHYSRLFHRMLNGYRLSIRF